MHYSINNLSLIKKEINKTNPNTNIIAVSKTFKMSTIEPLLKFGHCHFGENKVQEANEKWNDQKLKKKINKILKIFIQVNIDNENQKSGVLKSDLKNLYIHIKKELNLDIIGLMCIPPINAKPNDIFKIMKDLNDELNLKELSMGMSSDYLNAVNFGSTFILSLIHI